MIHRKLFGYRESVHFSDTKKISPQYIEPILKCIHFSDESHVSDHSNNSKSFDSMKYTFRSTSTNCSLNSGSEKLNQTQIAGQSMHQYSTWMRWMFFHRTEQCYVVVLKCCVSTCVNAAWDKTKWEKQKIRPTIRTMSCSSYCPPSNPFVREMMYEMVHMISRTWNST